MKKKDKCDATQVVPPLFSFRSLRLRVVLLVACAMAVQGLARGSFGMAAVCFAEDSSKISNASSAILSRAEEKAAEEHDKKAYMVDWSVTVLSRIHTSFYVGSFVTVLVVDRAVRRFGVKTVMAVGTVLSAGGSALTPFVVLYAPHSVCTALLRFIMGIGYAFVIPCGSVIISRWFPLFERSSGMAVFTTGNQVGTAGAMIFTAEMCEINLFGGWPLSFEVYGVVFMIFVGIWWMEVTNKPREHTKITAVELEYITGKSSAKARAVSICHGVPYRKILLSPAVFSICMCSFAQSYVVIAFVTYLPKYYQQALKMNLNENGLFSAAPFVVQMFTKMSFALIADYIKTRCEGVNQDELSKVFNAIACFGAGLCTLGISFLGADQSTIIMILMTASMGLFSGFVPGYNTSIVSVAPMFTATISAYAQVFSQIGSLLAPFMIGLITQKGTIEEWRWVFWIITGILFTGGLVFQFFGKCTAEPWADPTVPSHKNSFAVNSTRAASTANSISSRLDLSSRAAELESYVPNVPPRREEEAVIALIGRRPNKEVSFCEEPEVSEYLSASDLHEPITEENDDDEDDTEEIAVVAGAMS